jgi:hypothetical protein
MSTPLCSTGGLVLAAGDCLRMFAERRWTYMDVGNPETMRAGFAAPARTRFGRAPDREIGKMRGAS